MVDVLLVLFILPLGILSPFPAGINALFSHGPRRSAGLARVYALWNITSLVNVVSILYLHFNVMCLSLCIILNKAIRLVCFFIKFSASITSFLCLLISRLLLSYVVLYIISRQPKGTRVCSHGTWERKHNFPLLLTSIFWELYAVWAINSPFFPVCDHTFHMPWNFPGMKVVGGSSPPDSCCWNASKQGLLIGMLLI